MSPQLNAKDAQAVDSTEPAGTFELIPSDLYVALLKKVEVKRADGGEYDYWVWEFEIVDGEYEGRLLWNNTSLAPTAKPFLKKTFDAFGVPASTNTDLLCGQWVTVRVGTRTIQKGDRKGEVVNAVSEVLPYADDDGVITSD